MKKIITIAALFYCFIVIFVSSVNAFEFVKSTSNPLPITYIQDYIYNFQAHIYKEGNLYKGIVPAKKINQINYSLVAIESSDKINWRMTKEIFVNQGRDISNPRLIVDKEGNKKIFFSQTDGVDLYRIYSIDCDNDLNCSSVVNLVLGPDITNYTEKHGFFAPYVLNLDKYYLFYGVWGQNGFKIRLAYSETLSNWQKCPNDLISYGADGPFPYIENNNIFLFYHESDSSGIKLAKTTLPLSCTSVFEDLGYQIWPSASYDQKHIIYPSIVKVDEGLMLYYTGLASNYAWRINMACTGQACLPIPSPTPTLTPTPVIPIIILPGFMASWNKEAILHNQIVDSSAWKLQNFVKEYDGLINTLKNIGYLENDNLFLFPYDWRQSIDKTKDDLNNFLQTKIWESHPNQKINLIGHSLGGLIARIFTQNYEEKVNQIITVGSPHQGVVQVYKPLEAGEIDRGNTFLWLAEKIILVLNKSTIESDRVTITNKFPVAKDLFPTFHFLKDLTGNEISVEDMSIKNSLLSSYNQNFSEIFPIFTAIYGEKDKNTLSGYTVEPQNSLDQLLENYPDGKPKESYLGLGDYTVLSNSARQDTDSELLNFDHGEIITKKDAIKKILGLLNINFSDDQITEGKATKISSSLVFLIKSPAKMTVEFNNSIYIEDEGIIFIPDAQSGSYGLKVQGTDQGKYEVIVGQISENNDLWESINGEITQSPASSQIDNYNIQYNNQTALSIFPTPTITLIITPIPTGLINPSPTATPLFTQTPTATPTLNLAPTGVQISTLIPTIVLKSTNSSPEVLGISSSEEEIITPTPEIVKEINKTKIIDKTSIWKKIFPTVISLLIGVTGWIFKKKIFKNEKF